MFVTGHVALNNMLEQSTNMPWYKGPYLLQALDEPQHFDAALFFDDGLHEHAELLWPYVEVGHIHHLGTPPAAA